MAVDNAALAAPIPVGDVISVLSTLTAYSDPANFDSSFPDIDLLSLTRPLGSLDLAGTTTVTPEPGPGCCSAWVCSP